MGLVQTDGIVAAYVLAYSMAVYGLTGPYRHSATH